MQFTCQYASVVLLFQALADNCRNASVTFVLSISNVCRLYHTKVHQVLVWLSPLGSNLTQAGVSEQYNPHPSVFRLQCCLIHFIFRVMVFT